MLWSRSFRFLAVLALLLCLVPVGWGQYNSSVRPSQAEVRAHVLAVVTILDDKYRVELRWDDPERVNLPNGSFMVGIPRSEIRDYITLSLPSSWTPGQIAGMISDSLEWRRQQKRGNWMARLWRWVRGQEVQNVLRVPEPAGLFMVDKFSVPRLLNTP